MKNEMDLVKLRSRKDGFMYSMSHCNPNDLSALRLDVKNLLLYISACGLRFMSVNWDSVKYRV